MSSTLQAQAPRSALSMFRLFAPNWALPAHIFRCFGSTLALLPQVSSCHHRHSIVFSLLLLALRSGRSLFVLLLALRSASCSAFCFSLFVLVARSSFWSLALRSASHSLFCFSLFVLLLALRSGRSLFVLLFVLCSARSATLPSRLYSFVLLLFLFASSSCDLRSFSLFLFRPSSFFLLRLLFFLSSPPPSFINVVSSFLLFQNALSRSVASSPSTSAPPTAASSSSTTSCW